MTATQVADRSRAPRQRPAAEPSRRPAAGTWALIRLGARRERIPLTAWVLGISVVTGSTYAAFGSLYPLEAERSAFALSISANPAFLALTGPVASTSIGGLTAWRLGVLGTTLIGLMSVFTVVRRTRAEEETGRAELIGSTAVGRAAPLLAAVLLAGAASTLIGVITAAAGIGYGEQATGSVLFGAVLAGCGWCFAGVAAVTAQLTETARAAIGMAAAVLGAGFALRAIGDVASELNWLVWLSPQGWSEHVKAYGDNDAVVVLLYVAGTVLTCAIAYRLLERRDLGLAMFATRPGLATNPRLRSATALAVRLHRGVLIGWISGLAVFGAVVGGIAASAADLLRGNPQLQVALERMGGSGALTDLMISAMAGLAGLIVGAYAISTALRMHSEEVAERTGPLLATAVTRTRWMSGHLMFVYAGTVLVLAVSGLVAGVMHGVRIGSVADGIGTALPALLVQAAPALVMGGVAVALYGWVPRFVGVAWAALVAALLIGQLGPLLSLPQWLLDLSPYTHVPALPADEMRWPAFVVLIAVAVALTAVGMAGFRRRDVS